MGNITKEQTKLHEWHDLNILLSHHGHFCSASLCVAQSSCLSQRMNWKIKQCTSWHTVKPKWKGLLSSWEEVVQVSVTRTSAHLQLPSCYRLSCEMQLNLATPQPCRPGLRNSRRRCFLMGCEVLLLEVLGIMSTHVFFWHVLFSLHLKPLWVSEQGEEDNKSKTTQYLNIYIYINLTPGFKKEKRVQRRWRWPFFCFWLKNHYLRAGRKLSSFCVGWYQNVLLCLMLWGQHCVLVPMGPPSQAALLLRNTCWTIQLDVPMHIKACKLELD